MRVHLQAESDDFAELSRKMSSMMVALRSRSFHPFSSERGWRPSINVYEGEDSFVVCVDLAGMQADQIDVRTEGGFMIIRGDRPMPACQACGRGASVHLMEIDSGPFLRQVEIPEGVDAERISATYKHGFLWVSMPKRVSGEPKRS